MRDATLVGLGRLIRMRRKMLDRTLDEVARRSGFCRSTVVAVEQGRTTWSTALLCVAQAVGLGLSVSRSSGKADEVDGLLASTEPSEVKHSSR